MNKIIRKLTTYFLYGVMHRFKLHKWEITKWSSFKDRKCKYLVEEGFSRYCEICDKKQTLKKPKKYHPSKYVWTDSNGA